MAVHDKRVRVQVKEPWPECETPPPEIRRAVSREDLDHKSAYSASETVPALLQLLTLRSNPQREKQNGGTLNHKGIGHMIPITNLGRSVESESEQRQAIPSVFENPWLSEDYQPGAVLTGSALVQHETEDHVRAESRRSSKQVRNRSCGNGRF